MTHWLPPSLAEPPSAPFTQRRKGFSVLLAVGLSLAAVGLLFVLCIVGLIAISFSGVAQRQPTQAEKEAFLSIRDLQRFGVFVTDPATCEVFTVKQNVGNSWEFEYDYDPERTPNPETQCLLDCEVEVYPSPADAEEGFGDRLAAYRLGQSMVGAEIVSDAAVLATVDQSFCGTCQKNGRKFGHVLVVRKGDRVASIMLMGIVIDDPDDLRWLVDTAISRAQAFQMR